MAKKKNQNNSAPTNTETPQQYEEKKEVASPAGKAVTTTDTDPSEETKSGMSGQKRIKRQGSRHDLQEDEPEASTRYRPEFSYN